MAYHSDYVPGPDADFDAWYQNLKNYVYGKTSGTSPAWTHIPPARMIGLVNQFADWNDKFFKMRGPHTDVDTKAKNDARKAAETVVRRFVQQFLMFEPVTNEDRTAMRLHNKDTVKTEIGPPQTRAIIIELRSRGGFRVEIRFADETTPEKRAIPYGMNGCLLIYTWGQEKVMDYNLLIRDTLMTASPFTLALPPEAEGKFLSCACMWQNNKGRRGPMSDIAHIAVS